MDTAALSPQSHDGQHKHNDLQHNTAVQANAPTSALTPPTSDDMNSHKHDDNDSELSDLDDIEDDEHLYTPDHYYDGGKVPVFKPTMEQFGDFKKYMEKINKYGMKSGIVKVVAPQEWRDNLPKLNELIKGIKIKNPITQEFMGTHGVYTQNNMEKQRSYNLPEWKALTDEPFNQPPARRGERRRNQGKVVRGGASLRGRGASKATPDETQPPKEKRKPGRPRRNPLPKQEVKEEDTEDGTAPVPPTPTSPAIDDVKNSVEKDDATPTKKKRPGRPKGSGGGGGRGGQKTSVTSRRMNNQIERMEVVDEAAFEDFDWNLDNLDEFTAERCQELETAYWKSLTFAQPMYAADMPGSLFTDDVQSWNVAKLPNLLDVLGTKVPGVNTAYLYMGMWKATFAWHLEDVDLYSINYIHFGAPKQWYSISQEDARRFEAAMKSLWPNDSKACDQFLRHKTYLISPSLLKEKFNIEVNRLVHHEGEFVITYPYGYHSGYNLGYNCAESVNFALDSWLDFGRIARKCECEADNVWVDVSEIERKLRGEPTPEYYEETDDDDEGEAETNEHLPSPPASVKGKSKPGRKRKRDVKDVGPEKKKKRIRILIKRTTREPCVLCPNDAMHEPLLTTDNGKKAHKSCALYTPETWLSVENGVEIVHGVANIDKARLDLKCSFCRSKRGACFQCAYKKCTRAFHATCAAAAGVLIDCGPVPTFGEDGTEYFEEGFDFRCRYHRPRRAKNVDADSLENNKLVMNYAKGLKPQDVVQAHYLGSDVVFGGLVVENRPAEASVLVDILPEGDRVEVEWKWLLVLDPEDSLRPKPSSAAIPMPADMNKMSVSIENRQDGVPKVDDQFHDSPANKWAEFHNTEMPPQGCRSTIIRNPSQAKVHFDQPDCLYYYLPKHSTEGRDKFTDDPKGQFPVSKADFLDRVKPTQPVQQNITKARPVQVQPQQPLQSARPYNYKPKPSFTSSQSYGDQASRRTSVGQMQAGSNDLPPLRTQVSDPARPFPDDYYYTSRTLPAAFPGQHSNYVQHVRQNSGGESARVPFGQQQNAGVDQGHGHSIARVLQPAVVFGGPSVSNNAASTSPPDTQSQPIRHSVGEWTPPSQLFHSRAVDHAPFPPQQKPLQSTPASYQQSPYQQQYSQQQPQQQSSQQSQQQRLPSGYVPWPKQERMMHTWQSTYKAQPPVQPQSQSQGYPQQHTTPQHQMAPRNDTSPQAPTPSPLSVNGGLPGMQRPVSPTGRRQSQGQTQMQTQGQGQVQGQTQWGMPGPGSYAQHTAPGQAQGQSQGYNPAHSYGNIYGNVYGSATGHGQPQGSLYGQAPSHTPGHQQQ